MVPLESEKEERLVLAVIDFRDINGTPGSSRHFVITPRIARQAHVATLQLIEILPMHQAAIQVAIFHGTMK